MQAQLNPDGTTSSSTVVVSQAAWQLGLIAQGALQRGSDANGVLRGDALAVGHRTEFTLAGGNALVRSGGGDNTYIVNYGMGASDTGEGNRIQTQAGTGTHHLVVNTKQSVVLASGAGATDSVYYLSGATQLGKVLFTAGAMNDAALYARNEAGSVTLDATAWNAPVTLASHGGFNILKGNTSNVSFVVQQPAVTGGAQVVLSLAQAGGSNNTVQIFSTPPRRPARLRPSRPRCPNCCRPTARWSASRWTPTPTTSVTCWTWATRAWSTSTPARPPPGAT